MKLSVVVPAYNEEDRISGTLISIHNYLSQQQYDYEIIVVNDGSTDSTSKAVEDIKSKIANLKFIDNKKNHGKGYVVRQGMLEARGDFRLFTDADNSTTIDHIEKFWSYFDKGYDVVIASIAKKGAKIAHTEKFYKRWFGKMGNLWIQFWLLPGIWDTQRGFKMFTAKAARDLFSRQRLDRWGFDFEILAIARKLGYKIAEVPINWKNDPRSHVKLSAYIKTLLEVLKVRWGLWTGKYN